MEDYNDLLKRSGVEDDPEKMLFDTVENFRDFYDKLYGKDSEDEISDEDMEKLMDQYNSRKDQGKIDTEADLTDDIIDDLAKEVIKRSFDNGQQRKDLLGQAYDKVQSRVNEILKGSSGEQSTKDVTAKEVENTEKIVNKIDKKTSDQDDYEEEYTTYIESGNKVSRKSKYNSNLKQTGKTTSSILQKALNKSKK